MATNSDPINSVAPTSFVRSVSQPRGLDGREIISNASDDYSPTYGYSLAQWSFEQCGSFADVPVWLLIAMKELISNGLKRSDLWTAAPREVEVQTLASQIASGQPINWKIHTSITIVHIIKSFFQKLPTPLLTIELYDMWLGATQSIFESKAQQIENVKKLIQALPPLNRFLLSELLYLLQLSAEAEMSSEKLIPPIWGPVLLLRKNVHDFKFCVRDSANLLDLLIRDRATLFPEAPVISGNLDQSVIGIKAKGYLAVTALTPSANVGGLTSTALMGSVFSAMTMDPKTKSLEISLDKSQPWLLKINKEKFSRIPMYVQHVEIARDMIRQFAVDTRSDVEEYIRSLSTMGIMLSIIKQSIDKSSYPPCVIETYHLERFYTLLNDFLDSWKQAASTQSLLRTIRGTRVRAGFERIALYCHYELALFFGLLNSIYGSNMLFGDKQFLEHVYESMEGLDDEAKALWAEEMNGLFVTSWFGFSRAYRKKLGHLTRDKMKGLRLILDNNNTGFVSIFRFKEFLRGFGPLHLATEKAVTVANEPWFHGYMSSDEAAKILEPCLPGTFLVRFSAAQPGTVAVTWMNEDYVVQHFRLESSPDGFAVKRDGAITYFATVNDIVAAFPELLKIPFTSKIMQYPAFYGEMDTDEVVNQLNQEPVGTFLVRFSSQRSCFTMSVLTPEHLSHIRLGRTPEGLLVHGQEVFNDIEHFVSASAGLLVTPYYNAASVSPLPLEDLERRSLKLILQEDEGEDRAKIDFTANIVQQLLGDAAAGGILSAAIRDFNSISQVDRQRLTDYLSIQTEERTAKLFKHALKDEKSKQQSVKKEKTKDKSSADSSHKKGHGIFGKKDGFSCSAVRLEQTEVDLCKATVFNFTIGNTGKDPISWIIRDPCVVNSHSFFSCTPSEGVLEKGKQTQITVCIVLYKPVIVQRFLPLELKSSSGVVTFIPLFIRVAVSAAALRQEVEQEPYWKIGLEELQIENKLGGGASANVYKCKLYGATLALKRWDLGSKDHPPPDFITELEMYRALRHDNLVFFIGGKSEQGKAYIVTEFLPFGSLDNFMAKPPQDFKFNFPHKLLIAIDAAKGMRCVHRNNRIHRDLKSLNLLVDDHYRVKVADFGEAKEKDTSNMTIAKGTYNWMAPEVFNGQYYTLKADVFSYGIILWEILMEQLPDRDLPSIGLGAYPGVTNDLREKYPEYVRLYEWCCRRNPNKRPSFNQIVLALKHIRDFTTSGAS